MKELKREQIRKISKNKDNSINIEFYPSLSFNKLNGLLKKIHKKEEDEKLLLEVSYNIYDVMIEAGYETRKKVIDYFKSPNVNVVESIEVEPNTVELRKWLEKFLEEGYEGAMIRIPGVPYENKRSYQLCKYKTFEDEEFEIVGGEESVRQGMLGSFVMKLKTSTNINGKIVETFNAKPKGSHEELKEYWKNLNNYIGKQATVEFFERSEYGIPRFPVASKIHE